MYFLAFCFALALFVWAAIALAYGSVFLSAALFIVASCCFPAEFASIDVGGLTLTLDRLWFVVLMLQAATAWYRRDLKIRELEYPDVAIGLFTIWLIVRTVTQPLGAELPEQPSTLMHLVNGYLIPISMYAVLRMARLDVRQLTPMLLVVAILGIYLSVTAFLEIAKLWNLVVPSYIADPTLGIHFGRARGPMLQSVRLGLCLILCWTALVIYTVWLKPDCRFRWAIFLAGSLALGGAIFFTYTRSVWLGFAYGIGLLVWMAMRGTPRRVAIAAMLLAGMLVGMAKGPELIAFKREFSAAETKESTFMRAAFAYVSLEMFKDRPIAGYGFNQFQVYNRKYLSDRSTDIRLDSIRGYVHHNGFLSLLVDLGVIGFALYLFVMLTTVFHSLSLWNARGAPRWARGLGMLSLVYLGAHAIQMTFHELSFSSIENGLLFSSLGLMVAAHQQYLQRPLSGRTARRFENSPDSGLDRRQPHPSL
ncbi:MAG: O-antigen ligase family protein [bacterium]|nr:O-antigen ligase family protein [bacterium]